MKATIIIVGVMARMIMAAKRTYWRTHHCCGRLVIIPRAIRPDPERTLVASDRMARIDVLPT